MDLSNAVRAATRAMNTRNTPAIAATASNDGSQPQAEFDDPAAARALMRMRPIGRQIIDFPIEDVSDGDTEMAEPVEEGSEFEPFPEDDERREHVRIWDDGSTKPLIASQTNAVFEMAEAGGRIVEVSTSTDESPLTVDGDAGAGMVDGQGEVQGADDHEVPNTSSTTTTTTASVPIIPPPILTQPEDPTYPLLLPTPSPNTNDPDAHIPSILDPRRPATYHTFVAMLQSGLVIGGSQAIINDPTTAKIVRASTKEYPIARLATLRPEMRVRSVKWTTPPSRPEFEIDLAKEPSKAEMKREREAMEAMEAMSEAEDADEAPKRAPKRKKMEKKEKAPPRARAPAKGNRKGKGKAKATPTDDAEPEPAAASSAPRRANKRRKMDTTSPPAPAPAPTTQKKMSLTLKFAHHDMLAQFAALPVGAASSSSSATRGGGAAWASVDDISSSRAAAEAARAWNRFEVGGAGGASAVENPGLVDAGRALPRPPRELAGAGIQSQGSVFSREMGNGKKEEGKGKGKGKGKEKETEKRAPPPPTTTKSGRVTRKRERLVEEGGL